MPYKYDDNDKVVREGLGDALLEEEKLEQILGKDGNYWHPNKNWERVDSEKAIRKVGESVYTAKLGTQLIMNVEDITGGKSVLIKSIPLKLTPEFVR